MNKIHFKDFNIGENIITALEKLGYETPSKVQEQVIPLALEDKDIIVKSQTGSGKTAAFAIPICEKVELENNKPQALVLTPTRELCVQVKEDISNVGRFKRIRCAAVFGKQPISMQLRELKQRTHIVVGTPGRTLDHIERGSLNLDEIKYLVIDEADEMLNMGFIEQVEAVVNALPKNRVTMLFSATIPEEIEVLCNKYMKNPTKIEINPEKLTTEKIMHIYYEVEESKKFNLLKDILYIENPDSCIMFCNTKESVDKLVEKLKDRGYSCNGLHGGMLQNDRLDMMKKFRRGEFVFLVATDVAARGIDVDNITHVINYDIPMEKESYVHRTGRTARAGKEGKAISFISPNQYRFLDQIEEYIQYTIPKGQEPTREEVEEAKVIFENKAKVRPKLKKDKGAELNKDITKLYINAGKKKKIRPGDIVGSITSIQGVSVEDIGIIDIQDNYSHIDILNGKHNIVLKELQSKTIKGKSVKVQKAIR